MMMRMIQRRSIMMLLLFLITDTTTIHASSHEIDICGARRLRPDEKEDMQHTVQEWRKEFRDGGYWDEHGMFVPHGNETLLQEMLLDENNETLLMEEEPIAGVVPEGMGRRLLLQGGRHSRALQGNNIIIDVYFHVFVKSNGDGALSNNHRNRFVAQLNSALVGTSFQFQHAETLVVVNDDWAACRSENMMKFLNHVGDAETLNIWICDLASRGIAGKSSFPHEYASYPLWDGILMHNPGIESNMVNREVFQTMRHEIGHWLGLLHTFESGCVSNPSGGDGVEDTPPHAQASWNYNGWTTCFEDRSTPLDTCDGDDGAHDPIDNYMNYIHQDCMLNHGRFTNGQKDRMLAQWTDYRHGGGRRRYLKQQQDNTVEERRRRRYLRKDAE